MFSRNLKYFRLKKGMTKKALANQTNVTPTTIANYESGKRKPDMEILKRLAEALDIRVSDFLAARNEDVTFAHGEFKKDAKLSQFQQEFVYEIVEEYFNRFMAVVDILGGAVLPDAPVLHTLTLSDNDKENAASLRGHLGFSKDDPIEGLINQLENKGVLVHECSVDSRGFSGMNGFVNGRPYIVANSRMPPERIRSAVVYELVRLMFVWPESIPEKEVKKKANAISGAFLFPESDDSIAPEHPSLFKKLVCRAVNEQKISVQRGAELLQQTYDELISMCRVNEI